VSDVKGVNRVFGLLVILSVTLGLLFALVPFILPQRGYGERATTVLELGPVGTDHNQTQLPNTYRDLLSALNKSATLYLQSQQITKMMIQGIASTPLIVTPLITTPVSLASDVLVAYASEAAVKHGAISSFSTTNVQVYGIDEQDIVKTDGRAIYIAREKDIVIFDADNYKVASRIQLPTGWRCRGIYVAEEKLIAILSGSVDTERSGTTIYVFDIRNLYNPVLSDKHLIDGEFMGSRLKPPYLYIVTQLPAFIIETTDEVKTLIPRINGLYIDSGNIKITDYLSNAYLVVFSLNLDNGSWNTTAVLLPPISRIYMSYSRLYVVCSISEQLMLYKELLNKALKTNRLPVDIAWKLNNYIQQEKYSDAFEELIEYLSKLDEKDVKTIIESINSQGFLSISDKSLIASFDISDFTPKLNGLVEVNGGILDQFAIEEFEARGEPYLAVATTINRYNYTIGYFAVPKPTLSDSTSVVTYSLCHLVNGTNEQVCISMHINTTKIQEEERKYPTYLFYISTKGWEWTNSIYVVKPSNLEIVSELSELASGEQVYAARLIKNTLYLVTFRRVDPLFAIDLSNPEKPVILGYLKIPGFSEYLHPINDNLLLGIGREGLSIKVSLFDVSDPKNILEKATLKINGYSPIVDADDYHAFLFDDRYSLCYLPIQVIDEKGVSLKISGILIVKIDIEKSMINPSIRIAEHAEAIRAIYIENKLYTVSFRSIRTWSLPSIDMINETLLD
jgi:uncharacterized secreted protein with C-terminal beta-propeller domain